MPTHRVGGLNVWFGGADTPAPVDVTEDQAPLLRIGLSPATGDVVVIMRYRLVGGPWRRLMLEPDTGPADKRYFLGRFPQLALGSRVEYEIYIRGGGATSRPERQVGLTTAFRVVGSGTHTSPGKPLLPAVVRPSSQAASAIANVAGGVRPPDKTVGTSDPVDPNSPLTGIGPPVDFVHRRSALEEGPMEQELFRFIAVRSARPLFQDRWLQVFTSQPDATVVESPADFVNGNALLEDLSRWLLDETDHRAPEDVARWVAHALKRPEAHARRALRALVAGSTYRSARGAVAARIVESSAAEPVTDEPAVRVLLVCGLLERLATIAGGARLTGGNEVAAWLSAALVVDDGQPSEQDATLVVDGSWPSEPDATLGVERPPDDRDVARFTLPGRIPAPEPALVAHDVASWRPWMALSRPPRFGELVVVERELCGYEMGEVADIENVLTGEVKEHVDRDFELSEQTQVEETERTRITSESHELRDESRMRAEADQTLQNDTRFNASLNVEAKYPPSVTITAEAGFQLNSSRAQTDRTTAELAREVTDKTAKQVTDRELVRLTTRMRRERERRFRHRFAATAADVVGVYRFVDAVWTARSVRYDPPRLQCELIVPEPAAWLKKILRDRAPVTIDIPKPTEPRNAGGGKLNVTDITRENWAELAAAAEATGVPPPPEYVVRVARSLKTQEDPPPTPPAVPVPHDYVEVRDTLNVPEGYRAVSYKVAVSGLFRALAGTSFTITVGDDTPQEVNAADRVFLTATATGTLGGITDVVPVSIEQLVGFGFAGIVSVCCELTSEACDRWRSTVHSRIWAAFHAADELYQARLEEARSRIGDPPAGLRSTDALRLIETELRRLCLSMMAGHKFPRAPGIEPITGDFLEPDLSVNAHERERILFLEQAFEWALIQYVPYPYYWGRKPKWKELALEDGPDAMLAEFERAGAVRVVVPARDKFGPAVVYYLRTGRVWFGSRPPASFKNPLYLSIAMEVAEHLDRPRDGVVLDAWRFRLPTPHLILGPLPECPPLHTPSEPDREPPE